MQFHTKSGAKREKNDFFFFFTPKGTSLEQAKFEAKTLCEMNHAGIIRAHDWWMVHSEGKNSPTDDDVFAVHIQLELAKFDLV